MTPSPGFTPGDFFESKSISRESSAASTGCQHRAGRLIRTEIVGAVDGKQFGQSRSLAVDAALDGADRAVADRRRLLVGKTGRADENEGFAVVRRQFGQSGTEFLKLDAPVLFRVLGQRFRIAAVGVFDLAPAFAVFGAEQIAQDGEQPGGHVGAGLE